MLDLQSIIIRFSLFLANNSVIYRGSDWGPFGSSSNLKPCQSTPFFSLHPISTTPPAIHFPHSLWTLFFSFFLKCAYVPIDGDVKYLNTLCCLGTMHFQQMGRSCTDPQCMQISIQSSPGCFQYNTSASGLVLIPLYPQPKRCFIQSNALSAMSTWTSGHITEPKKKKKQGVHVH